jgi:DNA-binding SARP family transcriptional activator/tetratricopeptide (TPR) repeat protein
MDQTRESALPTRVGLGILGPLSARIDGAELNLGGRRQRAVVAVLLLARGQQVGTGRLLDALWEGTPPPSGAASLQSYVSHLRRALEPDRPARRPSRLLVTHGDGYAIPREQVDVDAWRFEDLVTRAADLAEPDERVRLLDEALALWRGPVLPEYAGADWADAEARRLQEIRDVARDRLLQARLDAGQSAIVVPEAEALLAEAPLREERWRLLTLAQYRSNRQADALATLRQARATLAEELGVDPGPALRDLERQVLAQSPDLDAPQSAPVRPAPTKPAAAESGPAGLVPPQRQAPPGPLLVDREAETARLRDCLQAALGGVAGIAVIEGPAGIGKTTLLDLVRAEARAAGATVLAGRGSQLEREFGFGVVRQLFEPVLAPPESRDALLTGAAAGASRVFDAAAATDAESDTVFTTLHGLYWLTSNLTARAPVVIAVDDVQWCDAGSLRFLGYLTRRLEDVPVLVVATWRTGERYADEELVQEIAGHPDAVIVRPGPLSSDGTASVVRDRLEKADDAFVGACFRTTSGNPLLLRQLLRALEAEGIRPDASHADTVRAIGSRAVSSMVQMRLRRMPDASRDVARAVAVLGGGASLSMVAAMTGHDDDVTATAVATLARSEVLCPDLPLGFVHPLVEAAVYNDLPLGEREMEHARAADVLREHGGTTEQVAAQLLQVPPRSDRSVVDVLGAAAQRDVERGSTESAIAYLRRALAEPPGRAELPQVLMALGQLEAMTRGMDALEHLGEAYRLLDDPLAKAECAIMLARTAVFAGPRGESTRIAWSAADDVPEELPDQRQALVALARVAGFMHGLPVEEYLTEPLPPIEGDGPGARSLAALQAWELLCQGVERERAIELAHFAVAERVLQQYDPGLLWVVAANVMFLAGEDTTDFWENELDVAHRTGSVFAALAVHLWLGYVLWQRGDLRGAMQSLAQGTEQAIGWSVQSIAQMYAEPYAAQIALDQGDLALSRQLVDAARDTFRIGDSERLFYEAEARVLLAEGRPDEALAALDVAEPQMLVIRNPAWRPWRSQRAVVLHDLGRTDEALALLDEELALAEQWGSPGLIGRTLRVRGEIEGAAGERSLRAAVERLAPSPLRLELARAQASLGRLLVAGDTSEARDLLGSALALADDCDAEGLWREVGPQLRALGVDVPDERQPTARLTGAEQRIATMTAQGMHEQEIAQALFITAGTVNGIVDSVLQRLGLESVEALRDALAPA